MTNPSGNLNSSVFSKYIIHIAGGLFLLVLYLCVIYSPKASAISGIFPSAQNAPDNPLHATVSKAGITGSGGYYGLDAQEGYFKVFISRNYAGGSIPITIRDACKLVGDDLSQKNYTGPGGVTVVENTDIDPWQRISVQALKTQSGRTPGGVVPIINTVNNTSQTTLNNKYANNTTNGACVNDDMKFSIPRGNLSDPNNNGFNNAQVPRYSDSYRTILIFVKYTQASPGAKSFRVQVDSGIGYVSVDDLGSGPGGSSISSARPGTSVFAIKDAQAQISGKPKGYPESRYRFTFKPDCNYNESEPVYLKWTDADYNSPSNNEGTDISWTLKDLDDPNWGPRRLGPSDSRIGGDGSDSYRGWSVGTLKINHRYQWEWQNVDRSNGLKMWMPFSEINGGNANACPPTRPIRAASCEVTVPPIQGLPPNSIVAGENFTVNATFTNRGSETLLAGIYPGAPNPPYPANAYSNFNYGIVFKNDKPSSYWYIAPNNYYNYRPNTPTWLDTDETVSFPINSSTGTQLKAPTTPGDYPIDFYPDHLGFGGAGGFVIDPIDPSQPIANQPHRCPIILHVYDEKYEFQPDITTAITPDNENPGTVSYSGAKATYVEPNPHVDVPVQTSRALWRQDSSGNVVEWYQNYVVDGTRYVHNDMVYPNFSKPGTSFSAGDQICSRINVRYTEPVTNFQGAYAPNNGDPAKAYLDKNGKFISGQSGWKAHCIPIVNKPYFKTFGSGVSAGGSFMCNWSGGLLAGWNDNTGSDRGASSQLSALALIKITGFASAQTAAGRSPTELTFANNGTGVSVGPSNYGSPTLGGSFSGSRCLFLPTLNSVPVVGGPSSLNITGSSGQRHYNTNLELTGGTVLPGHNLTIFIDGDVRISGPIGLAAATTGSDFPSFILKATGNIYIDPGVTSLDGIYIAQNKIYTCSNGGYGPMAPANMFTGCANQLVVHGSFIANQVNLMRTFGSLRNSVPGENSNSSLLCDNPVSINSFCAGEVFDFSPEMYLANPSIDPPSQGALKYDSYTSLPPVL